MPRTGIICGASWCVDRNKLIAQIASYCKTVQASPEKEEIGAAN